LPHVRTQLAANELNPPAKCSYQHSQPADVHSNADADTDASMWGHWEKPTLPKNIKIKTYIFE